MNELYKNNMFFREYVDRYCIKHEISKEEAFKHRIIGIIANYYEEEEKEREKK